MRILPKRYPTNDSNCIHYTFRSEIEGADKDKVDNPDAAKRVIKVTGEEIVRCSLRSKSDTLKTVLSSAKVAKIRKTEEAN